MSKQIRRPVTSYNLVNLIHNGAFELVGTDSVPFWTIQTNYTDLTDYRIVAPAFYTKVATTLTYSNPKATFDFVTPTAPFTSPQLRNGYLSKTYREFPYGDYTVSLGASSNTKTSVLVRDSVGTRVSDVVSGVDRHHHHIEILGDILELTINVIPIADGEASIDRVMMANGHHIFLPYTGDPFNVIPKGAIIMALGEFTPPGFEVISETLYPYSEDTPATHGGTTISGAITPGLALESNNGYLANNYTYTSDLSQETLSTYPGLVDLILDGTKQAPVIDSAENHSHTVEDTEAKPTTVRLRFCRKY